MRAYYCTYIKIHISLLILTISSDILLCIRKLVSIDFVEIFLFDRS